MSSKQRVMVQPINVIFKYMQQQTKVSLWLYDIVDYRLEGRILVRCHERIACMPILGCRSHTNVLACTCRALTSL